MQDQDMQGRLQAALDTCARMQDQRDQLAEQAKDATAQCGVMAELLREAKESVYFHLESPDSNLSGLEAGKLIELTERIADAMAGKLPEPFIIARGKLPELTAEEVNRLQRSGPGPIIRINKPAVPEGWQLVPVELTRPMLDVLRAGYYRYQTMWTDVLAAAPKPEGEDQHTPEPAAWLCKGTRTITLEQVVADDWRRKGHIAIPLYKAPVEAQNLSRDAKESLQAMIDYCLRNGIAMGIDEGFKSFEPELKYPFRIELESFCAMLAAAPKPSREA